MAIAVIALGGSFAYTYINDVATIGISPPTGDIATCNTAASQPDWNFILIPPEASSTEILNPNAAGDETNIQSQVGAGAHWQLVDDWPTHDGDSTVVYTGNTSWEEDLYNLPSHTATSGNVTYVKVYIVCRSSASPTQTNAYIHIKTGGTEHDASAVTTGTSYGTFSKQWDTNPNTGDGWTWDEVDSLQIGVGLRRPTPGGGFTGCTQVYAEIGYGEIATAGDVPTGDLFTVHPNPRYSGDLQVGVYLANTGALVKAYQYLNMQVYMEGSVSANQTPNHRLLTLQNGQTTLSLESLAGISDSFYQTSQSDFESGNLTNLDTTTISGDVILDTFADNVTDNFTDESKIAYKNNVAVSNNQVKLIAGGSSGTETLRPNAAGDDTNISYEYPAWYNSSWSHRMPVTINNSGSALTDYQVEVDVNYDSDMQADFDDIRFTDTDGATLLPYWRESYTASTSASFRVKIPSIPAGTKNIFMYYGNATASSSSNGTATFIFFDDFSGDLSKWNIHIDTDVAITSGYGNPSPCLEISGGSTSSPYGFAAIGSDATYSGFQDGIIEADIYPSTNALPEIIFRGNYASNTGYKGRWDCRSGTETPWMKPPYGGWAGFGTAVTRFGIANQWQSAKLVINGSQFQIYNNGSLKSTVNDAQYSGPGEIGLANHYGSYARFDNVRVRKYAATEPTVGLGTEETQGGHWDKVDEAAADDYSTYVYTNSANPPNWYNSEWRYRKKIIINSANVSDNLTDFPILINSTDADWKYAANGGHVAQSDGGDILFTSSDGTSKVDHEIESYNATSGALVAWVEVPTLYDYTDTDIYIYYGNQGAADQWNIEGTWSDNFSAVWHLKQTTGGTDAILDSTSNNNDGTDKGTPTFEVAGQIGNAIDFNGSSDYIEVPSSNSLKLANGLTIEAWINIDTWGNWENIVFKGDNTASNTDYQFALVSTGLAWDGTLGGSWRTKYFNTSQDTDTWIHVAVTHDTNTVKCYRDGSQISSQSDNGTIYESDIVLGVAAVAYDGSAHLAGTIDEVRISDKARGVGWIETGYNSQSSPGEFYSIGTEESSGYERDLYNIPDHATGLGKIDGVTVYFRFSGDNVTGTDYTGYARAAIKTNGVVYDGDEQSQAGKTFATSSHQWTNNPYTGSAWTWDEIDDLQIGVSLRSGNVTGYAYCTQLYLEVDYTAYSSPGTLTSVNLLSGETVASIDTFNYNASAIPSGTALQVQYSTDNTTWYNSAGTPGGWDTMSQGTDNISLSGLGWSGPNFYYNMQFTSDSSDTPILDMIGVYFSTYYATGNLTSAAYDTGDDQDWDWKYIYFTSNEPTNTDVKFQIRSAATEAGLSTATWYGPTGTGDYYTASGTEINSVHDGDRWIQYRPDFSGPGDFTPTLSDIELTYTLAAVTYTVEIIGGSYGLVSANTSDWASGWTVTPEFYCEVTQR